MKTSINRARTIWRGLLLVVVFALVLGTVLFLKIHPARQVPSASQNAPVAADNPSVAELAWLKTNDPPTSPPATIPDSVDRVADARLRCGSVIAARFVAAGVNYPPASIFLRVFKHEGELELWARDTATTDPKPFRLVSTYTIQAASGRLGPKRQEGDRQVPEGFYTIDRFNPRSLFHLSLGLNYPNPSDLILTTNREAPGSDVFIHGGCASVGCMAMGDPVIEEIFLAAFDAKQASQNAIPVHIFPCRMNTPTWTRLLIPICNGDRQLKAFWQSLQKACDLFERSHLVPSVQVREDGSYVCLPATGA